MRLTETEALPIARIGSFLIFLLAPAALLTRNCEAQDRTVRVALSTATTTTSNQIQIVESTEMPIGYGATMISHDVKRIGIYHRGLKRFVLWNGYMHIRAKLNGLPNALLSPHGISMKDLGDGRLGVQYEFNVPEPGVYIINTTWSLKTRDMKGKNPIERKGNPSLLFVEPSPDYDRQEQTPENFSHGIGLQKYLEERFDENPGDLGLLLPKFDSGND